MGARLLLGASILALLAGPVTRAQAPLSEEPRNGAFVEAGVWVTTANGTKAWFRGEVGIPLPVPGLSLMIPALMTREQVTTIDFDSRTRSFLFAPGARYDLALGARREFSIYGEAGLGLGFSHTRRVDPTGHHTSNSLLGTIRIAAGASYVAPFGLMVTLQPIGFAIIAGNGDANAFYELAVLLGYRWR